MGTTPTYSWPYPEATGLVKDGWEDIKDLATAIDTTAASSFGGGLVHLNTTSFSAVSSQDFNDIFNSTYDHYRIIFRGIANTSEASMQFQMKTSTVDSSTIYRYYDSAFGVNTTSYTQNSTGTSAALISRIGSVGYGGFSMDLYSPNLAEATTFNCLGVGVGTTTTFTERTGGVVASSTQYTGIRIAPASNNMTGSISIYGYKK